MELHQGIDFARSRRQGVLATLRLNGRPQLSNILYLMDDGGVARISITDSRAKTQNLRRDPRASLYVPGDSFWSYLVFEGMVDLSRVAADPSDPVADELVDIYREHQGEHPDWDEYRQTLVSDGRLVARFVPERAYGMPGSD